MPEAAEQILLEQVGKSLHFNEVTDMALKRGFKGKRIKPGASTEGIAASFRRMMAQRPDKFEQLGRRMFRINEEYLQKQK